MTTPGLRHPGFDGVFGNANDTFGSPGVVRQDVANNYTSHAVFGVDQQGAMLKVPLTPGQVINGIPFELNRATAQLLNTLTVSAAGTATVSRPIGTSPALIGLQVHYQWLVVDSAAAGGLAASPAASFTLF